MTRSTIRRRSFALIAWLAGIVICGIVVSRTVFTTDLSAFLPQSPSREQRVLLDQLRDGMVSRLILIGIEGGDAATRAALSKEMVKRLRGDPALAGVSNGEPVNAERDRAFLFDNRYLLSPDVTPQRFSAAGLHDAIRNSIDLLASPMGMFAKELLPRDPTGEMLKLFDQVAGGRHPRMQDGVWVSRDGKRALLLAQTQTPGADIDGQQQAMQRVQQAFDAAARQLGSAASPTRLLMTGPGVFSVQSRKTIESEAARLSMLSALLIVSLLLAVYRSVSALLLGLLPVISGALAGVATVSLGFGMVHGITLGFGTTLIGEAVDYSIYLFVQSRQASTDDDAGTDGWLARFWPTIRLGVLISIAGFSSLLLSSFPGLAQLGLYSIAGLVAAAAVTRFVLPHLLPSSFHIRDVSEIGTRLARLAGRAPALRLPLLALVLLACLVVLQHRANIWNPELSSLSPVSQADVQNDASLRADLGAPDVRYMIALSGASREQVLRASEQIAARLDRLVAEGILAGYESPSRYLPSMAAQRARQAALPAAAGLQDLLKQATQGLPVRPELFAPFVSDVQAARARPPLQRADLDGTSFALAVDSLMYERAARWHALLPLTAGAQKSAEGQQAGELPAATIRAALAEANVPDALFVDLKAESGNLYSGYLREAALLSLAGLAAIAVLLMVALRSVRRAARVLLPLIAAVLTVMAGLLLAGERLTILHLIGLLLIVAVGSNYALFFVRQSGKGGGENAGRAGISPQTLASLAFANLTTVIGFGLLGFSQVPVLHGIGATVGPGAVLALVYAAVFAGRPSRGRIKSS